jgi:hypothetical protein
MNTQVAEALEPIAVQPEQTLDVRPLADAELEHVNGGLLWAVLGLGLCFEYGVLGGMVLHRIVRE